ncbi:energy transducer TonB [Klebsiella variicola]|uniref:energy transducer TonB n=1 Tax=Klebsiella variicola TaxID=244366 RepID=UPI0009D21577|nr:energy transducer TonB [Klebsiella variicola]HCI5738444.1 energy transducer TonB [Klebsiella variicola subsp. variicola]HCI6877874.1 energy transducer TonB [Klebsiella quasipneumoniae subsp. similipneumoniae]SLP35962.1 transport protein TonB [Klebsiella variicola]SXG02826.1 transport protein TonB [Klebsiella variicola]HED4010344.1 energy transducer TonB [Klebsiella variicola subsp. variicola]
MQQALLKAALLEGSRTPLALQPADVTVALPPGGGEKRRAVLAFLAVAALHVLAAGWLVTRTTEYTPLNLVTPQQSATVQATLVEYYEPPQEVQQPPVMTAERGEREVAPVVPQPPVPSPPAPEVKPATVVPRVKPPVKKTPPPKPQPQPAQVAKAPPAAVPTQPSAAAEPGAAIPGGSSGRMMQNNSSAQPKNVAAIGCAVPEPDYPRRAQRLKQEGEVLVRLVINAQGQLTRYEVARSSGFDALDEAALAAVQKIHCAPYLQDGQPIAVMTLQPVNFRLAH